jgi:hypothetical protein
MVQNPTNENACPNKHLNHSWMKVTFQLKRELEMKIWKIAMFLVRKLQCIASTRSKFALAKKKMETLSHK